MKLKNVFLTVVSSALLITSAHAVVYTDLDVFNGAAGTLVNASNPLNGEFEINSQGYNSQTQQVTSAAVSFLIYDDSLWDGPETVTIDLGSSTFIQNQEATFLFAVGGVTGSALFDLSSDGILKFSIIANSGDFLAINGLLTAVAQPKAVPDGGMTAILLGTGFLGICALQRRFALAR
jgi:hypothetical protein